MPRRRADLYAAARAATPPPGVTRAVLAGVAVRGTPPAAVGKPYEREAPG